MPATIQQGKDDIRFPFYYREIIGKYNVKKMIRTANGSLHDSLETQTLKYKWLSSSKFRIQNCSLVAIRNQGRTCFDVVCQVKYRSGRFNCHKMNRGLHLQAKGHEN